MVMGATISIIDQISEEHLEAPKTTGTSGRPEMGLTRVNRDTIIGDTGWKLALDMGVALEYASTYVIATNPWVDDYGQGDTEQEATDDLLSSLVDFRESLERQSQAAELSEVLVESLYKLRILLVRSAD